MAKVSTSGAEAQGKSIILSLADGISVNGDHYFMMRNKRFLHCMKRAINHQFGRKIPVVGETGYATLVLGCTVDEASGYISEHDMKIAKKLAYVIAGGKVPFGTEVDEQYLLDLEREAFLSLIAEAENTTTHATYARERKTTTKLDR